jgi:2-keto-4-pentenoate hydratase
MADRASAAARLLLEARAAWCQLDDGLPEDCRPRDLADAYEVQDRHVAGLCAAHDAAPIGYKVGCTNATAQKLLGLSEPFSGVLLDRFARQSPASIPGDLCFMRCIEAEFAFRLGGDLPASAAPFDTRVVAEAIAAVLPAIEIVDTRYRSWTTVGALALIADQGSTGLWVAGAEREDWRSFDLPRHTVRLLLNGQPVREGVGGNVLGNPLVSLVWLANDLARRGHGLQAGEVITTGTCIEVYFAAPGDRVCADFGTLGQVEVGFAA